MARHNFNIKHDAIGYHGAPMVLETRVVLVLRNFWNSINSFFV